jgi:hypothetical protein
LGSASDYASIPQNVLLAVVTGVVYRFGSRQQRFDRVWQMLGAVAFATAAVSGVLTVTGLLPGVSAVAAGAVIASAVWLLAIGAKITRGVLWAAIPFGLIVVQFFLAYAAYSAAIIGVLHGLNALAIFAVALLAARRAAKPTTTAEASSPAGVSA